MNSAGILYNSAGLYSSGTVLLNNGGAVTGNELVNNQGNIYFSAAAGGKVDHNKIHESYGEGIQLGGNSTSSSTVPQTLSYNLIYHLGVSASTVLYNGIDCNGNPPNVCELNDTIVDTNSASTTLEGGCTGATVKNNIFDQHTLRFPTYDIINPSFLLYALLADQPSSTFSNNLWLNGTTPHPFHVANGTTSYTCTDFFPNWPDVSSFCADPLFVSIPSNNYHLQSGSPARGTGTGGTDIGACAYGSTTFPCN